MAAGGLIQDDTNANFVLREMHRELIRQINVDEITIHLIAAGMLTDAQQDALQNSRRGARDRTKYLLSNEVLGGRGFSGLNALLDALRGNQLYKPHLELAQRIETSYSLRIRRSQDTRSIPVGAGNIQQQPADPRTGEFTREFTTCFISQHSLVSMGETHHSKFTTAGDNRRVPVVSGVQQRRSPSPIMDDGDVYSSCKSLLTPEHPPTASRRSLDQPPQQQGLQLVASNEVILQKHKSLRDVQTLKMIIVGNSSVGKTSIIQRFVHGKYERSTFPTCGTGYSYQYVYHPKKNVNVKLHLWDTMGQDRYHSITANFYRNSDAAVIVFDLTSPDSLNHVHWWHQELKKRLDTDKDIPIVLAGNKCDLIRCTSIRPPSIMRRARQKAFDLGLQDFIIVSARSGHGMEELFERTITLALETSNPRQSRYRTISLENNQTTTTSRCPCYSC